MECCVVQEFNFFANESSIGVVWILWNMIDFTWYNIAFSQNSYSVA